MMRLTDSTRSGNSSVYRRLRERLRRLGFVEFQKCVLLYLGNKGYRHIRHCGRNHQRGRHASGIDFVAFTPGDPVLAVAVQIRHWKTPIQRRVVSELWGEMLRRQIPVGLIVTASRALPSAVRAAESLAGHPISIVTVDQLALGLLSSGIGFRVHGGSEIVDESLFRTVTKLQWAHELDRFKRNRVRKPSSVELDASLSRIALVVVTCLIIVWLWLGWAR